MSDALLQLTKEQLATQLSEAQFEIFRLKDRIAWFERQMFGSKSERYISTDKNQLELALGELEAQAKAAEIELEKISYERRKRTEKQNENPPVRTTLPAHLRREETIIMPEGDLSDKVEIGEEITEYLKENPGEVYVVRIVRKKYATRNNPDAGVMIAPLPQRGFSKFMTSAQMISLIIIRKYVDHLPIFRQLKIYKRHGLELKETSLHGWIKEAGNLLEPLYSLMLEILLARSYLQSDDTKYKVLEDRVKRETLLGYMWVYQDPDPVEGLVIFQYSPRRTKEYPDSILRNYIGYLQCDGLAHYESFEKKSGVILLNCWAHARRKFKEALENDFEKADWMMRKIRELYEIERIAREGNYTHEQRHALRQEKSLPLLKEIKEWLTSKVQATDFIPKSLIGNAIQYTLARMDKLTNYCLDGKLEIDNNLAENSIRPIVLGRKNYMFAATHESAQRAAIVYSITATCRKLGINPEEFFADVLNRIEYHPVNRLHELLPWNWKAARTKQA